MPTKASVQRMIKAMKKQPTQTLLMASILLVFILLMVQVLRRDERVEKLDFLKKLFGLDKDDPSSTPISTVYTPPRSTMRSTMRSTPSSTPSSTVYSTPSSTIYSTPSSTVYSTVYSTPSSTVYSTPSSTPFELNSSNYVSAKQAILDIWGNTVTPLVLTEYQKQILEELSKMNLDLNLLSNDLNLINREITNRLQAEGSSDPILAILLRNTSLKYQKYPLLYMHGYFLEESVKRFIEILSTEELTPTDVDLLKTQEPYRLMFTLPTQWTRNPFLEFGFNLASELPDFTGEEHVVYLHAIFSAKILKARFIVAAAIKRRTGNNTGLLDEITANLTAMEVWIGTKPTNAKSVETENKIQLYLDYHYFGKDTATQLRADGHAIVGGSIILPENMRTGA
jgi:hypothetical protein